jgi:hypothetical protein
MLRITRQSGAGKDTLLLEGKLLKEWLEELGRVLQQVGEAAPVTLDLSGLSYIDVEAAGYLRACRKRGIALLAPSAFVKALIDPPRRRRSRLR